MSTIEQYRAHAHECLERANTDSNEGDKPLWLTLAQSWLQLADERASRAEHSIDAGEAAREAEPAETP